jgi:hypothetical protein
MTKSAATKIMHDGYFPAIYPGITHTLEVSGTSAISSAVSSDVSVIRLVSTIPCFIEIGTNPTATDKSMYMPKDVAEYFGVCAGEKIAAIKANLANGQVYITEGKP